VGEIGGTCCVEERGNILTIEPKGKKLLGKVRLNGRKLKWILKKRRPGMVKNFLFSTSSRPAVGPIQPPIQWVPGALSLGVKWLGHEADHSSPTSAEVKKIWIYTFTPLYAFMV
jgi:hypothetical protein